MIGRAATLAILTAAVVGASSSDAAAGTFEVKSCFAGGEFSTKAFVLAPQDLSPGMGIGRACTGGSHARIKGIVTADRGSGVRPRGSRAIVKLLAPAGTRITSVAWRGGAERSDCGWEMAVYAADGQRVVRTIQEVEAGTYRSGQRCPRRLQPQVVPSHHVKHEFFTEGATRIVQRIVCRGYYSKYCSARGANYIRTLASRVTIEDRTPPSVQITGGSLLGGWVSRDRSTQFTANDAVGVQSADLLNEDGRRIAATGARQCDFSAPAPCPSGPWRIDLDTQAFTREGTQQVQLRAFDAAGNAGLASTVVHIDNTPPPRVDLAVQGGDGWHRSNDFAVGWQNQPEPDRAPINVARYRICRADGRDCSETSRRQGEGISDLSGLSVPSPGEWNLIMWREDQAGNTEEDNASVPVRLRYDPDPPQIAFEPSDPFDPTRVALAVKEDVSGLATGRIEMSREGSGSWQDLPTSREGDKLLARVDDSKYAPGTYLVRGHAGDNAGNEASTDRRADGSPMVLRLPLRVGSAMRAGVRKRRFLRRHGRKRKVVRLDQRARVRLGRTVRLSGSLTGGGRPLINQTVYVTSREEGGKERVIGTVTTDSRGRYSYLSRASRSRVLRFVYLGTSTVLPAQREVTLLVPAVTSLRAARQRLRNGQSVLFGGRLRSVPLPAGGKLVELQVRLSGRWQTFRTVRADPRGRWRVRYRFRRTVGVQRYAFRARVPRESGYPFEAGHSRKVPVRVRG